MIGHVDDRFLVGRGIILDVDAVVAFQCVGDVCSHITREVVVSVRRLHGQLQGAVVQLLSCVNLILPSCRTAVQTVSVVVLR